MSLLSSNPFLLYYSFSRLLSSSFIILVSLLIVISFWNISRFLRVMDFYRPAIIWIPYQWPVNFLFYFLIPDSYLVSSFPFIFLLVSDGFHFPKTCLLLTFLSNIIPLSMKPRASRKVLEINSGFLLTILWIPFRYKKKIQLMIGHEVMRDPKDGR